MSLKVYRFAPFSHLAHRLQFAALRREVALRYANNQHQALLLANYAFDDVQTDALLLTTSGFHLFLFKNVGGRIVASPSGAWLANGCVVEGGDGGNSPLRQAQRLKQRAEQWLQQWLGVSQSLPLSVTLLFEQDAEVDLSALTATDLQGLNVMDHRALPAHLASEAEAQLSEKWIQTVPARLHLAELAEACSDTAEAAPTQVTHATYQPEDCTNFFAQLKAATALLPTTDENALRTFYGALQTVFTKCINQNTADNQLNLCGPFAKTSYLLEEYQASRALSQATNALRVRLKTCDVLPLDTLAQYHLHDLKALCQFIAFIYRTEVPLTLQRTFPTDVARPASTGKQLPDCLRFIVRTWNADHCFGKSDDDAEGRELKVSWTDTNDRDWSYLIKYVERGTQLNLLRARERDGVIVPELIIYEPDYLVDISAIASCFTDYADSPLVYLLKKLQPNTTSEPILLGNFASQLLDESIHGLPQSHAYTDSVKDFFKQNALPLVTTEMSAHFHSDAQLQKQHIDCAIHQTLPQHLLRFQAGGGVVEPSFFSEMLGVQGRMDYLQTDFKVLIEQKSGKGAFPYNHFVKPTHRTDHYVQLLLYMALIRYNYRATYERNRHELHAFLLYSKYAESLVGLGFAPNLLFDAIKVRNGIVRGEMTYAQPYGFRLLERLTPEMFNEKGVEGKLWNEYQRPQIEQLLRPIHEASPLERAYYFRFLTFIANEHLLSKVGNKTKESSGMAATWHDSLEEKLLAGNIYNNLTLQSLLRDADGRIDKVVLDFSETADNDMANFRAGDVVILYPYDKGTLPDARLTMLFRCSIDRIEVGHIRLTLRATQTDDRLFAMGKDKLWAIEHDFIESSFTALYRGMQAFLTAPQERRDLLLFQREPSVNPNRQLRGDYGHFNELALRVKQADDVFLIIGPPGTGKTSFGMLNTVKEELLEPGTNLLLLSYTNRAVDEMCSKLFAENIDFIKLGRKADEGSLYRRHLLSSVVEECRTVAAIKQRLRATRIFVGTTTALCANLSLFQLKSFSLAVIDEASQILEPHLMALLSAHRNGVIAIRKFVLIGDHKQLPAVVSQQPEVSKVNDLNLLSIQLTDCRLSLFERFLKHFGMDNPAVCYMLRRQGRMHEQIAAFPNMAFYNHRLTTVPLSHQCAQLPATSTALHGIDQLLDTHRLAFIAASAPTVSTSDKVNQHEADIIAALALHIYRKEEAHFNAHSTLGIIVPYRNQIATVRSAIDAYGITHLHDIAIDTVERYQGSQRDYIIYGFTIQQYYQLNFLTNNTFVDTDGTIVDRKLNVAMTRAKRHLFLVGNPTLLANNFTFYQLMAFAKSRSAYFEMDKDTFISGQFTTSAVHTPSEPVPPAATADADWTRCKHIVAQCIDQPLAAEADTQLPTQLFGVDAMALQQALGYGRLNATQPLPLHTGRTLTTAEQALAYNHFYFLDHYARSRTYFAALSTWLTPLIEAFEQRVQFIDYGCGAAVSGLAFADRYLPQAPRLVYTGVDSAPAMTQLAQQLLDAWQAQRDAELRLAAPAQQPARHYLHAQLHSSLSATGYQPHAEGLSAAGKAFWDACGELPTLVVFHFADFFAATDARTASQLARTLRCVMQHYPQHRYAFLVQHQACDAYLQAYQAFSRQLDECTECVQRTATTHTFITLPQP